MMHGSKRLFFASKGRHTFYVGVYRLKGAVGFGPILHWDRYSVTLFFNLLPWEFEFEWRWEDEPHGN